MDDVSSTHELVENYIAEATYETRRRFEANIKMRFYYVTCEGVDCVVLAG
jgi:ribosomal protein L28